MAFIALLLFIITAIRFMYNSESSDKRSSMFKSMAIIVLGIFVIFSIYTIFVFVGRLANSDIALIKEKVHFGEYKLIDRENANVPNIQNLQRGTSVPLEKEWILISDFSVIL